MKLSRKGRWALLLPHLRNPYYAELVEALNKEARIRQTTLLLGLSLAGGDAADLIEQWTAGETDGLILDQSYYRENPELFERLRERGQPMVFLHGRSIPGFDFVRYDLYGSCLRNLRTLGDLGHRRIAYVSQAFEGCRSTSRFEAYAHFHEQNGIPTDETLIYFGEDGHIGGIKAWEQFATHKQPPTAVICGDDIIACGVFQAARSQGLLIPRDLSLSGVDNIAEAERLCLTTVNTDRAETSRMVLDLLERRIVDPSLPPQISTVPSTLILRDTQAPPRIGGLSSNSRR